MDGVTEPDVWDALGRVTDPELPLSLVDLGMIYGVRVETGGRVVVELTFTSMGCPGMDMIFEDIRHEVGALAGVEAIDFDVVWSPPWTKARITPHGRRILQASGLSV